MYLYTVRLTRDFKPEGAPQLLTRVSYGYVDGLAWTSNREVVYSAGTMRRMWRMRVGAGSPELLNWTGQGPTWPAAAPARRLLAYTTASFTGNLWRMDLRTGERRIIVDSTTPGDWIPQYSPDGRKLAFQSSRSGEGLAWTCDSDGTNCEELRCVQEGGSSVGCGSPRWSPDGRWIAFDARVEGTPQIYVIPSDGGRPRRLTSGTAQEQVPSWSRDGKWIYFDSDRSGQWRVWKRPAEGGSAIQVTEKTGGAAFESVDGKYLYINTAMGFQGGSLFRMPVGGGPEVEVAPKVLWFSSFSVTAKGVYLLPDTKTLQLLDAATGKITTVAKSEKGFGDCISVSPDDAYVLVLYRSRPGRHIGGERPVVGDRGGFDTAT